MSGEGEGKESQQVDGDVMDFGDSEAKDRSETCERDHETGAAEGGAAVAALACTNTLTWRRNGGERGGGGSGDTGGDGVEGRGVPETEPPAGERAGYPKGTSDAKGKRKGERRAPDGGGAGSVDLVGEGNAEVDVNEREDKKSKPELLRCLICHDPDDDIRPMFKTPCCGQIAHKDCALKWNEINSKCFFGPCDRKIMTRHPERGYMKDTVTSAKGATAADDKPRRVIAQKGDIGQEYQRLARREEIRKANLAEEERRHAKALQDMLAREEAERIQALQAASGAGGSSADNLAPSTFLPAQAGDLDGDARVAREMYEKEKAEVEQEARKKREREENDERVARELQAEENDVQVELETPIALSRQPRARSVARSRSSRNRSQGLSSKDHRRISSTPPPPAVQRSLRSGEDGGREGGGSGGDEAAPSSSPPAPKKKSETADPDETDRRYLPGRGLTSDEASEAEDDGEDELYVDGQDEREARRRKARSATRKRRRDISGTNSPAAHRKHSGDSSRSGGSDRPGICRGAPLTAARDGQVSGESSGALQGRAGEARGDSKGDGGGGGRGSNVNADVTSSSNRTSSLPATAAAGIACPGRARTVASTPYGDPVGCPEGTKKKKNITKKHRQRSGDRRLHPCGARGNTGAGLRMGATSRRGEGIQSENEVNGRVDGGGYGGNSLRPGSLENGPRTKPPIGQVGAVSDRAPEGSAGEVEVGSNRIAGGGGHGNNDFADAAPRPNPNSTPPAAAANIANPGTVAPSSAYCPLVGASSREKTPENQYKDRSDRGSARVGGSGDSAAHARTAGRSAGSESGGGGSGGGRRDQVNGGGGGGNRGEPGNLGTGSKKEPASSSKLRESGVSGDYAGDEGQRSKRAIGGGSTQQPSSPGSGSRKRAKMPMSTNESGSGTGSAGRVKGIGANAIPGPESKKEEINTPPKTQNGSGDGTGTSSQSSSEPTAEAAATAAAGDEGRRVDVAERRGNSSLVQEGGTESRQGRSMHEVKVQEPQAHQQAVQNDGGDGGGGRDGGGDVGSIPFSDTWRTRGSGQRNARSDPMIPAAAHVHDLTANDD